MTTDCNFKHLDPDACRVLARYLGDLYYLRENPEVSAAIQTLEENGGGCLIELFPSISDKLFFILVSAISDYIACTNNEVDGCSPLMQYRIHTDRSRGGSP